MLQQIILQKVPEKKSRFRMGRAINFQSVNIVQPDGDEVEGLGNVVFIFT
jgi:hypothetical protein